MLQAARKLVDLAIRHRDAIEQALWVDAHDPEYQQQITDFNSGTYEGFFPAGKTAALLAELRPSIGFGEFEATYQQANAEAIEAGLGSHLLPKLENLSHEYAEFLSRAQDAYERSSFSVNTPPYNAAIVALAPNVNRLETGGGKAKQKRGTKKNKKRKIDIAITIVVREPTLTDAEVARQSGCSSAYLSSSKEYKRNAEFARRSLAAQREQAEYDRRTGRWDQPDRKVSTKRRTS